MSNLLQSTRCVILRACWAITAALVIQSATAATVTCPAAIVSSGTLSPSGNAKHETYWGEVLASGNIRLLTLSVGVVGGGSAQIDINSGLKMQGAGIDYNSG